MQSGGKKSSSFVGHGQKMKDKKSKSDVEGEHRVLQEEDIMGNLG